MRDVLGENFYGSFRGRLGRGSGEAHFVSDTKFQKCVSVSVGSKQGGQNGHKRLKKAHFMGNSLRNGQIRRNFDGKH